MSGTLRAATSISGLTLLSRILGLVRDSLMMRVLGANWASGALLLAWMIPNLFRRLFGEGALSSSFIPAYSSTLEREGQRSAGRLLAGVSGALLTALVPVTGIVLLLCLVLPAEAPRLPGEGDVSSAEVGQLFLDLVVTLFPYVIPICLVAVYAGALNSLGSFAVPAASPIVLNCFWIAGIGTAVMWGIEDLGSITRWLAVFLLCGGLVQLGMVLIPLFGRRALSPPVLGLPPRGDPARAVFRAMVPTLIGLSVVQVSALVDQAMAFYLVAPGANNYIYLANRLMLFPYALTSLALATAVFPSLAVLGRADDRQGLRERLDRALTGSLFLSLPAALGLGLIGQDLVRVLFQHGAFTAEDTQEAYLAAVLLVLGLPFVGSAQLHARAFYALGDMSTPARVVMRLLVVNLVLNLIFVLGTDLGAAGLTLATSLTAIANAAILRSRFSRICPEGTPLRPVMVRCGLATAAMGLCVWILGVSVQAEGTMESIIFDLGLPILAGVAVYGLVHWILRSPELGQIRRS